MAIDQDACYRILEARDSRYDGLFFVGVSSTGIYCRCICPAKTPKRANCSFFDSAASAEQAGYRPCLRCRPENAPGRSHADALKSVAHAAARRIDQRRLEDQSLEELATDLGVTGRHLRRAVKQELGVSPANLLRTSRLLMAKKLLAETRLPIGEVALTSGFGSVRRFNEVFQTQYRLSPSQLRKSSTKGQGGWIECRLSYRPPYDWESQFKFLKHRQILGVESIEQDSYARSIKIGARIGWIKVIPQPQVHSVSIHISDSLHSVLPRVLQQVRRVFDLDANPGVVATALGELGGENPGLRLPGAFDGFEAAVRAILGQQISVSFATVLAGRFAERLGEPLEESIPGISKVFPNPSRIALCKQDEIASLGIIGSRARAIIGVAQALDRGDLKLDPDQPYEKTRDSLRSLPGIGPWTAEYVCMRSLSYPDAFPAEDVGVFKALGTRDRNGAIARVEKYRPWRAYAVMHLWNSLR